jgi:superfamily II DNA or RNA helicase
VLTADLVLKSEAASLVWIGQTEKSQQWLQECKTLVHDKRFGVYRSQPIDYRDNLLSAQTYGLSIDDQARSFQKLNLQAIRKVTPRPHQSEALTALAASMFRGVVQLPTGAGKTMLALLAMEKVQRSTLVIVPTIELLFQWRREIETHFGVTCGVVGGGFHAVEHITVSTYESAVLRLEALSARFGFLIVDECHHLAAIANRTIGSGYVAPFRLGLSATVARADGGEAKIYDLLGPLVFDGKIGEMTADVLAPYKVESIEVPLSAEEKIEYEQARSIYLGFVRKHGIRFDGQDGWRRFLMLASRTKDGRAALAAYRRQKNIAFGSTAKVHYVWELLRRHAKDRVLIFTHDNNLAYAIGTRYLLPVLTHQTGVKERKDMLARFAAGEWRSLVTSKVLNEGVDVPEANVAIIVSGSGAVREHVQRLGRILRRVAGKQAVLYEMISQGTSEYYTNKRRREHDAYKAQV